MSQWHSRTASRPHNLPAELNSFVGRRHEMAEVKRALQATRLLTLTGAGGAGKTRLALRVASDLVRAFPDGVWAVELANLQDPALVAYAVFMALGLRDRSASWPVAVLTEYLSEKRLLLVMDNCEHLLTATAVLVETLLRGCPGLRVLATSRWAYPARFVLRCPPYRSRIQRSRQASRPCSPPTRPACSRIGPPRSCRGLRSHPTTRPTLRGYASSLTAILWPSSWQRFACPFWMFTR